MIPTRPRRAEALRTSRRARPAPEALEERKLLYSTTGGSWSEPIRVTYSIVPDGTSIGGTPSNLVSVLDANPSTASSWRNSILDANPSTASSWRNSIRRAAAAWQNVANINLVEVTEATVLVDGRLVSYPIGVSGSLQGDIRIGGYAQGLGQLGFAFLTAPLNDGTAAGDIFFNTSQAWANDGSPYDFATVILHEMGHALGLGHSEFVSAAMYSTYSTSKRNPTTDDINGLRSIYGAQPQDAFEPNNSLTTPSVINHLIDGNKQVSIAGLTLHANTDSDWFQVTVPAGYNGPVTVRAQATGLSSVIPGVLVYNGVSKAYLGGDTSQTAYGSTASVTLNVVANQVIRLRALSIASGPTNPGAGSYGLQVNFGTAGQAPIAPPSVNEPSLPIAGAATSPQIVPSGRGPRRDRHDHESDWIQVGHLGGFGDVDRTPQRVRRDHPIERLDAAFPEVAADFVLLVNAFLPDDDGDWWSGPAPKKSGVPLAIALN